MTTSHLRFGKSIIDAPYLIKENQADFVACHHTPHLESVDMLKYAVSDSGITVSKKRDCLKLKGERVYLIVGMKQRGHRQKNFYLWCYTQVEEIEAFENENYGVYGTDFICKKPIRLNDLPGFEHFAKHTMGSFAYGLQNAINDPFSQVLMNDKLYASMEKYNQKALRWLADFEDGLEDSDLWLTNKDGRNHPSWFIFEMEPNTSTAYPLPQVKMSAFIS